MFLNDGLKLVCEICLQTKPTKIGKDDEEIAKELHNKEIKVLRKNFYQQKNQKMSQLGSMTKKAFFL